jgi:adenylate cyclase
VEIERKFLVSGLPSGLSGVPEGLSGVPEGLSEGVALDQGYLVIGEGGLSEARLRREPGRLSLTVKHGHGLARGEYEVELSVEQFDALWPATSGRRLEKTRSRVPLWDGLVAEVDVYAGALAGLSVVEVEFSSESEAAAFVPPDWFGREVTEDDRYKNRRLATDGIPSA